MLLLEASIALSLLLVAAGLVAQLVVWSTTERMRADVRLAALEWAHGVLEEAGLQKPLTPDWAARQSLPEEIAERYGRATAVVAIAPEPAVPGFMRVSIAITWTFGDGRRDAPVTLTRLVANEGTP